MTSATTVHTGCEHSLGYNATRRFSINSLHIGQFPDQYTSGLHDDIRMITKERISTPTFILRLLPVEEVELFV